MKEAFQKVVLIMISLFFGGFFLCNNAYASITFQDDFDSYSAPQEIPFYTSGSLNGWRETYNRDVFILNDNYYSSPNSVGNWYYPSDIYNDNAYLNVESGYISFNYYVDFQFGGYTLFNVSTYNPLNYNSAVLADVASQSSPNCWLNGPADGYVDCSSLQATWANWVISWNKVGTDLYDFEIYVNENLVISSSDVSFSESNFDGAVFKIMLTGYQLNPHLDDVVIENSSYGYSEPVDAVCGSDDGQYFEYPEAPENTCSEGELAFPSFVFHGSGWTWICSGLNGGESVDCEAYNESPVDAVCGSDDGQILYETPENTCSTGYLAWPSFVRTLSGWTWICQGINGGEQAYCSAIKGDIIFPDLPELEDCSTYLIPDKWTCEIRNTISSVFLPSKDKLNELNTTINKIQGKAPFNYLSTASTMINNLKNEVTESPLSFSLMGNTSQISTDALEEGFSDTAKGFITTLVVLAFMFWALNYIKHFFK